MSQGVLILAQAAPGGGGTSMLLFFGLMLAVMYFVMILPQQRQVKQHKAMLAAVKKGDEAITQGGMVGKVFQVGDKRITLEVANGVRIQVLKSAIQTVSTAEKALAVEAEEQKEKS